LGTISRKPIYFFLCDANKVANHQLYKMLKRHINCIESKFLLDLYTQLLPLFKHTPFYQPLTHNRFNYIEFAQTEPKLVFTQQEKKQGEKILSTLGFKPGKDWFVCIFARDSAYLSKTFPDNDWSYHNIRNMDINSFKLATEMLLEQGAWIFRIGNIVEKPMEISHKRFVDYPFSTLRSDFMDIYLVAHARFVLGSSSGITNTAWIFNVPTVIVGCAAFLEMPLGQGSINIPKRIKKKESGEYLSYAAAYQKKLGYIYAPWEMEKIKPYIFEEPSPTEICGVVKEMLARLNNSWQQNSDQTQLLQDYFQYYYQIIYDPTSFEPLPGTLWLQENCRLYFPDREE
jgi:putative glycosyltransferase (TIGR04372 family)